MSLSLIKFNYSNLFSRAEKMCLRFVGRKKIKVGYAVLEEGGTAINAVKATVVVLEDNMLYDEREYE